MRSEAALSVNPLLMRVGAGQRFTITISISPPVQTYSLRVQ